MNSFVINSCKGGISDYEDKGIAGAFKLGINLDIRKAIDSISCQQTLVQEGEGVIVDLIRWYVPSLDGNTYMFGSTGHIYKRTSIGGITLVYTDPDGHAITGAAEFYCNNGKTYLFWATDTDLHCKEIPGNTSWTDVDASVTVGSTVYTYPKTNLTSSDLHPMAQAVGCLMIGNYDYIAFVGYDGSYTNAGLNIFKKNGVKSLLERGNYVIAGCPDNQLTSQSDIISWDSDAGSYNDKKKLQGGAINAMVDTDVPLMQVGTNGAIYYGDMATVLPITYIPGGGYCNPGGVCNDEGLALFGIYGNALDHNGIYSYGKNKLNQDRTLNLEYDIGVCDEIGAICKVDDDILVSYRVGTSFYSKKVDTANKAIAYYYSLDLKAPIRFNQLATFGPAMIFTKPMPDGTKLELFYRLDKKGSFIQAKMEGGIKEFTTLNGTEATFLIGEKGKVVEVALKLTPTGNETPEANRLEIYFE